MFYVHVRLVIDQGNWLKNEQWNTVHKVYWMGEPAVKERMNETRKR